ncbi:Ger(x)C family spore germination protein [Paenibacillus sp. JNUCC31]|uniref:Ger(x)C family spore germination protein n=1 Tax=Paenibacillus sp. JNUCC-31 TaxID=2777983 RepID=UPI001E3773D8|nr:Ger(x)C family spore germination protein [Paenibacillus sp. JNUCC-31]
MNACKSVLLIMATAVLLFSTGCWDRKEVNDLAIVRTAGLDLKNNGEIELSLEIVIPKEGGGKTQQGMSNSKSSGSTLIWSASGATAADAASELQIKLSRTVYWGQLEILVVGEALSRSQLREQLDYLVRDSNVRLRVQPFVCKGTARDFLASAPPLEKTRADFLGGESEQLFRRPITLNNLVQNLGNTSNEAFLPYVDTTQDGGKSVPYVKGYAAFSSYRMAGLIQGESYSGAKWILEQVSGDVETVKLDRPSSPLISLGVLFSSTRIDPKLVGEIPRMDIVIEAEMSLMQNTTRFKTMDSKFIRNVEEAAVDKIRQKAETTIKQAQKMRADIFGFGEEIERHNPRKWKHIHDQWERIYPSIQANVQVKVRIRQIGMNSVPVGKS